MYTHLATATLKTGQPLACGVVVAPDAAWAPRIIPFLAHKRPEWRFHAATLPTEHGAVAGWLDAPAGRADVR